MPTRPTKLIFGSLLLISLGLASCDGGTQSNPGGTGAGGNGTGAGTSQGGGGTGAGSSQGGGGAGAGSSQGGAGAGTNVGGGMVPVVEIQCAGHLYQCGDTIDNDGDGLIDVNDPDCLGPCDNTEDSYYNGIPGGDGPNCVVECYWDSNSGSGNDDCFWSHECDPNEQTDPGHPEPNSICPYNPDANIPGTNKTCADVSQTQSDTCHSVCGPLTPNGCDCFGCCELPAGTGKFVWLGSEEPKGVGSCSIAVLDDPTLCEPCLPVPSCYNDCLPCELCIGKDELPPECTGGEGGGGAGQGGNGSGQGGGPVFQFCPPGIQACGLPGQASCPADYYCITGCCQPTEVPK